MIIVMVAQYALFIDEYCYDNFRYPIHIHIKNKGYGNFSN